jgi:hypothetical protein
MLQTLQQLSIGWDTVGFQVKSTHRRVDLEGDMEVVHESSA